MNRKSFFKTLVALPMVRLVNLGSEPELLPGFHGKPFTLNLSKATLVDFDSYNLIWNHKVGIKMKVHKDSRPVLHFRPNG